VATEEFDPTRARAAIVETPEGETASPPSTVLDFADEPAYDLDAELARIEDQMAGADQDRGTFNTAAFGDPIDDSLVGTDASGFLADAIVLFLQPTDGDTPAMVSLPRDLFVWNMCKQTFTRLNSGLGGCKGMASGAELLAIMVEDYTGIPVDHLARVDFDGFSRVIDTMGGITVCLDHPRRDLKSHLDLAEAGCQLLDGEEALAWVRSRHPEELIDGSWRALGGSDFGRQERQQEVLFQLAAKAATFTSPTSLTQRLSAVASSVRLDSSWSFGDAVLAGWRYRGISADEIHRFPIDVHNYRTSYGAEVLLPAVPFQSQLSAVYDG
jgi:LCP family protein required for cell wall assembly